MLHKQTVTAAIQSAPIQTGAKRIAVEVINELPDESEVVEVRGCGTCPLLSHTYDGYDSYRCDNPNSSTEAFGLTHPLFASCPLKTRSLTIILKQ